MENSSNTDAETQSSMPLPVAYYWKQYTNTNVAAGLAPKPPQPIKGPYTMFGMNFCEDDQVIRPLESQGLPRLYPQNYNKKNELKKLVVSILCNFFDLLQILVESPSSSVRDEKLDDLNVLFINIHHIINEFRPHQARETLKVIMEVQKKEILEARTNLADGITKAQEMISKCLKEIFQNEDKLSVEVMKTESTLLPIKQECISPAPPLSTRSDVDYMLDTMCSINDKQK